MRFLGLLAALGASSITVGAGTAAQASIVAVGAFPDSQVGLTIQTPAPGTDIAAGFVSGNDLPLGIAFAEQQDVTLADPLALDTGGVLSAGSRVSSYFVAFDSPTGTFQYTFATFSRKVLGILYRDASLGASDFLGLPTLNYNTGCIACGYEDGEFAGVFGNTVVFASGFQLPGDYARVITAAVPEPSTWGLLITGFAATGLLARRRRLC